MEEFDKSEVPEPYRELYDAAKAFFRGKGEYAGCPATKIKSFVRDSGDRLSQRIINNLIKDLESSVKEVEENESNT